MGLTFKGGNYFADIPRPSPDFAHLGGEGEVSPVRVDCDQEMRDLGAGGVGGENVTGPAPGLAAEQRRRVGVVEEDKGVLLEEAGGLTRRYPVLVLPDAHAGPAGRLGPGVAGRGSQG